MSDNPDRLAICAWLRDRKAQFYIINLTMAGRNGDVIAAMSKCADLIEHGDIGIALDDHGMPIESIAQPSAAQPNITREKDHG